MDAETLLDRHKRTGRSLFFGLLLLIFGSCSRPTPPVSQDSPTPAPNSTTNSAPSAPTLPVTSTSNSTAGEVYFVVKYFSVSTESGVHGFTPGMPVRLVRKDGNMFVVSDGRLKVRAAATYFSRDPAGRSAPAARSSSEPPPSQPPAADPIPSPKSPVANSPVTSPTPNFQALKERKAARAAAQAAANKVKRVRELQEQIADLDQRIKAAEQEISRRGAKQAANPRHYTYDAWGNAVLYQGTYVVSYSADATGINQLRLDREKHKRRLAELTSE